MKWITEGFEGFSKGTMENGGQNLYVSKKGVLQRVYQYDVNLDGYPDILFACSQSMYERPPIHIYKDLMSNSDYVELPSNGTYDGIFVDLFGNGYEDLVLACQHNGTHSDVTSILYFGGPEGLSERYRMELPAPNAISVAAGDFNGSGKQALLFVSNGKLRMFYQSPYGFNPADFMDYDVEATYVVSDDIDGDGFCDAVIKTSQGDVGIIFGSPEGLKAEEIMWMNLQNSGDFVESSGSTAGVRSSNTQWKPSIIKLNGKKYLFCINKDEVTLYECSSKRIFHASIVLTCPGAVSVATADLNKNGFDDLAIAVFKNRNEETDCRIYLGNASGIQKDKYVTVPVKGAVNTTIADLDGPKVIFCRTGESVEQEVMSPVISLTAEGKAEKVNEILGGDCIRIIAGKPQCAEGNDQIAVLNHKMNRLQGGEDVLIYLGGEDGYTPERRLGLPGHSAVEGTMCDFFDRGTVDVLVTNCFEDAVGLDDGSYIYLNAGKDFKPDKKIKLPTLRSHGSAIGDFRKSGYLDIAFGGFENRELLIFHGSENGYTMDNCTSIVLGPDDGTYKPFRLKPGQEYADLAKISEGDNLMKEYGQVRWLFTADFNGDGWLDLFVSEILGSRCLILWGGPEGFSKKRMTELQTDGVASATAADLDGDGYLDLILSQHQSTKKNERYESYVTVYWGSVEGFKENRKMQLPVHCANSVTVGDYNGNGRLDLYATAYNNGRCRDLLSHLYKNENGKFSTMNVQYLFNHSGCGCVSGDFNGDGYTDLAVACHKEYGNHASHSFIFWGGPEGLSESRKTVLPTYGPHGMCTVDPGNIMNRCDKEYYTSAPMKLSENAKVTSIEWEGKCTSTSWVELEMRSADTAETLEHMKWQPVETGKDLSGMDLKGVVQYRIALCAKCACGTPRIERVIVNY